MFKQAVLSVLFLSALQSHAAHFADAHKQDFQVLNRNDKPWMFFDLGETLVTSGLRGMGEASKVRYMPGARNYLKALSATGYTLGLIANIPDSWGKTKEEKLQTLKNYIDGKWAEPEPFDWAIFADRILLPQNESERKPSPVLFERAKALAAARGATAVFQGDSLPEVQSAGRLGLRVQHVQIGSAAFISQQEILNKKK